MRNALYAGIMASIIFGVIGTFVVVKRIIFISGAISHASFGGVGMAFYIGIDPLIGAAIFAITSALGIGLTESHTAQREDTAIGIAWAVGMAIGAFFIAITPGYTPSISSFLFGNIIMLRRIDLYVLLIATIGITTIVTMLYPRIQAVCFDEEFSKSIGVKTTLIYLTLLVLVAISVVVLIKFVGIILVIAMMAMPVSLAGEFSYDIKKIMISASILSIVLVISGLTLAYITDSIAGATIVLLTAGCFAVFMLVKWLRER